MEDAVVNFIIHEGKQEDLPAPGVQTCRNVLPHLSAIQPKWKKVRTDNFNPGKYPAHQSLQDTVRNLINNKPRLERMLMEAQHEMDHQTDAENNNPPTPGEATEIVARFGNEDEIMRPPEDAIRNLNLPDSSEDVRTQNVETQNAQRY